MTSTATSDALKQIISTLDSLEADERGRLLSTLVTYYGWSDFAQTTPQPSQTSAKDNGHQTKSAAPTRPYAHAHLEPKDFLKEKNPQSGVERIACLAFYLAHYRDTPYFKTHDLTKLNTEAAQPKFANPSQSSANALKVGYLVAAHKGHRQLSAFGEDYVTALPDRDAAKEVANAMRPKRTSGRKRATANKAKSQSQASQRVRDEPQ